MCFGLWCVVEKVMENSPLAVAGLIVNNRHGCEGCLLFPALTADLALVDTGDLSLTPDLASVNTGDLSLIPDLALVDTEDQPLTPDPALVNT